MIEKNDPSILVISSFACPPEHFRTALSVDVLYDCTLVPVRCLGVQGVPLSEIGTSYTPRLRFLSSHSRISERGCSSDGARTSRK